MAKQIGEDTKVTLDLKTIGMIAGFIVMLAGMWYTLQADIAEAKELPKPDITRMEFNMKDINVRQSISNTEKAVEELKIDIRRMEDKIDKLR